VREDGRGAGGAGIDDSLMMRVPNDATNDDSMIPYLQTLQCF
jgi:hypothetical protein